jgi:hypothetical protein
MVPPLYALIVCPSMDDEDLGLANHKIGLSQAYC